MADPKGTSPQAVEEFNAEGRNPKQPNHIKKSSTMGYARLTQAKSHEQAPYRTNHPTSPGASGVGKPRKA